MIVNVGRFFIGGHSKKQDILVRAFKEMIDRKMLGRGWELHLVGGIAPGDVHEAYVEALRKDALGYPVYFHFSSNFSQLQRLYSEAKIYWHGTGYGEDKDRNPIRFEHFGITIVEAMASGCIPIVFRGGGIPETVSESEGLLWDSINELQSMTQRVAQDKKLFDKLSKQAREKSKYFSRERFVDQFFKYVDALVE